MRVCAGLGFRDRAPPESSGVLPIEAKMVLDEESLKLPLSAVSIFQGKEICSRLVGDLTSGKAFAHFEPSVPCELADVILSSGFYL